MEQNFGRLARFHRLVRDYERLTETAASWHRFTFACLMLARVIPALTGSA